MIELSVANKNSPESNVASKAIYGTVMFMNGPTSSFCLTTEI